MKRKLAFSLIIFIIISFICSFSYCANFSVSSSTSAVSVGGTYTVNISAPGLTGKFTISSTDNVSISTTAVWFDDGTLKEGGPIIVTGKSTGTATVTITASSISDGDGSRITGSTSTSVLVTSSSSSGGGSSSGGTHSDGSSAGNKITSLQIGDKIYSNPNKDITIGSVDASTDSITIKPTTSGGASYTINGGSSTNVALKTGTNVITIAVSGGDTYKVRITRLAQDNDVEPNIIDESEAEEQEEVEETKLLLTSLKVKNFELTPEFNSEVYSYTININMKEKNVDKLDIDAIANAADATVEIIGNENLVEGENIITILVKSVDGEESVVYQIIVNKIDSSSEIVSESVFDRIGFLSDMEPFQRNLLIGFSAFVLLLVIVVIIIIVKKARKNKEPQIPFEGINSKDDVDEAQDIADEEQEEVEIIEESEEPKAEEEQTKQEDSNETFETMNTTLLDEEKAALMDEFFSYNQSVEDNTKAEKKKDKKKGRGKGKHF